MFHYTEANYTEKKMSWFLAIALSVPGIVWADRNADLQSAAKEKGRPWEPGKAFDKSAPVSGIRPAAQIGHPRSSRIWLEVNGQVRQDGNLSQMIWPVPDIVAYLSQLYALQAGDLIFTGTPAGVGFLQRGDEVRGGVDGVEVIRVRIV